MAYLHRYWNIGKENATHCQARQHNQRTTEWNPICFPKPLGQLRSPSLPLQGFHLELPRLWWAWYHLGCPQDIALSRFFCLPWQFVGSFLPKREAFYFYFDPVRRCFGCLLCYPQRTQRSTTGPMVNLRNAGQKLSASLFWMSDMLPTEDSEVNNRTNGKSEKCRAKIKKIFVFS